MDWVGAIIPTLQATANFIGGRRGIERQLRSVGDIADLHNEVGQELLSAIYEELQDYQDIVEPNVSQNDRLFASTIRREMYKIMKRIEDTARDLDQARRDPRNIDHLRALSNRFDRYGVLLNNLQHSLNRSVQSISY